MKQDKTWLLLPMIAYTKYQNGNKEFSFGWLSKIFWIKF